MGASDGLVDMAKEGEASGRGRGASALGRDQSVGDWGRVARRNRPRPADLIMTHGDLATVKEQDTVRAGHSRSYSLNHTWQFSVK